MEKKQGHEGKEDSRGLMAGCIQTRKLRPLLSSRLSRPDGGKKCGAADRQRALYEEQI